jgi:hypothetical protein
VRGEGDCVKGGGGTQQEDGEGRGRDAWWVVVAVVLHLARQEKQKKTRTRAEQAQRSNEKREAKERKEVDAMDEENAILARLGMHGVSDDIKEEVLIAAKALEEMFGDSGIPPPGGKLNEAQKKIFMEALEKESQAKKRREAKEALQEWDELTTQKMKDDI